MAGTGTRVSTDRQDGARAVGGCGATNETREKVTVPCIEVSCRPFTIEPSDLTAWGLGVAIFSAFRRRSLSMLVYICIRNIGQKRNNLCCSKMNITSSFDLSIIFVDATHFNPRTDRDLGQLRTDGGRISPPEVSKWGQGSFSVNYF